MCYRGILLSRITKTNGHRPNATTALSPRLSMGSDRRVISLPFRRRVPGRSFRRSYPKRHAGSIQGEVSISEGCLAGVGGRVDRIL
jgi:hypothetical protein